MKRLLPLCLLLPILLLPGCWHRKNKPKVITAVATDVEEGFKQRWMERRTAELVAQGQRVDIARQQALDEFRARYPYVRSADK
jgi:hypothetical protein